MKETHLTQKKVLSCRRWLRKVEIREYICVCKDTDVPITLFQELLPEHIFKVIGKFLVGNLGRLGRIIHEEGTNEMFAFQETELFPLEENGLDLRRRFRNFLEH